MAAEPVRLRRSSQVRRDFVRIARFWVVANSSLIPEVFAAIRSRILWLAAGNYLLGARIEGLGAEFRTVLEPRFGYRIYYRLEGDPVHTVTVLLVRHARQRPPRPSTVARYSAGQRT